LEGHPAGVVTYYSAPLERHQKSPTLPASQKCVPSPALAKGSRICVAIHITVILKPDWCLTRQMRERQVLAELRHFKTGRKNAQRHQAEYDRSAALVFPLAGPSNPERPVRVLAVALLPDARLMGPQDSFSGRPPVPRQPSAQRRTSGAPGVMAGAPFNRM
jgi:hypothetical protein